MQVGVITINGRPVGVITQRDDYQADMTTPPVEAPSPAGAADPGIDDAYGGRENYSLAPGEHHHRGRSQRQQNLNNGDRGGGGSEDVPRSSAGNPFDRSRFSSELQQKPWLKEKIARISLGENQDPNANLAVLETMMNRAVVRGTSLEKQALRHKSSGLDEGGYYAGYAPHYSSNAKSMFDRNLNVALSGSNITNYATDNASGGLAARERATGKFIHHKTINGESFFSPGHAEPVFRDRWRKLKQQATDVESKAAASTAAWEP